MLLWLPRRAPFKSKLHHFRVPFIVKGLRFRYVQRTNNVMILIRKMERKGEDVVYTMELRWHENSVTAEREFAGGRSASSRGRRRAVQGHLPGRFSATAAADELIKGPVRGWSRGRRRRRRRCSRRSRPVHVAGPVRQLRVRGLSRRPGARQRGGGGRGPGGAARLVAGGVALRAAAARAVLPLLLRMRHLHLLAVGSNPVLQR